MSWDAYVARVMHKIDDQTNSYTMTNCASGCGIYGLDGTPWGGSEGFSLQNYPHTIQLDEETSKSVDVNEFTIIAALVEGKKSPCEAGIRIGNEKYMLSKHFADTSVVYLSCMKGGACIAKPKTAIIVGLWDKNKQQSDGKSQNPGMLNDLVEKLQEFLKASSF